MLLIWIYVYELGLHEYIYAYVPIYALFNFHKNKEEDRKDIEF